MTDDELRKLEARIEKADGLLRRALRATHDMSRIDMQRTMTDADQYLTDYEAARE